MIKHRHRAMNEIAVHEVDLGHSWCDLPQGPKHRAAFNEDTGELYIVQQPAPPEPAGEAEVLAVVRDPGRLERALSGWREVCGYRGSLAWLRDRARRLDTRTHVAA